MGTYTSNTLNVWPNYLPVALFLLSLQQNKKTGRKVEGGGRKNLKGKGVNKYPQVSCYMS